jgi:hypothetical protein
MLKPQNENEKFDSTVLLSASVLRTDDYQKSVVTETVCHGVVFVKASTRQSKEHENASSLDYYLQACFTMP